MNITRYQLYYFYGGFTDTYKLEHEFNNFADLIKYHKKHRNTILYNQPTQNRNDFVKKIKYYIPDTEPRQIYNEEKEILIPIDIYLQENI